MNKDSYFNGSAIQLFGWELLAGILTAVTFGICFPWAICLLINWRVNHTVINGKKLYFDGNPYELFGYWIIWLALTIITFGIYGFWVKVSMMKWEAKHIHFED
jgi:uncharacterized membrane protein YjgN (DUF898 family)